MRAVVRNRAVLVGLVVGLPLSALFLWLALRDADLDQVRAVLGEARIGLVALAVLAIAAVYLGQAVRWRAIARTPAVTTARFAEMVVSGVAVNNVLPGRVGDLLRARWLQLDGRDPGRSRARDRLRRQGVRRARARRVPRGLAAVRGERRVAAPDRRRRPRPPRGARARARRRPCLHERAATRAPKSPQPAPAGRAGHRGRARRADRSRACASGSPGSASSPGRCGRSPRGSSRAPSASSSRRWTRSSSPA